MWGYEQDLFTSQMFMQSIKTQYLAERNFSSLIVSYVCLLKLGLCSL